MRKQASEEDVRDAEERLLAHKQASEEDVRDAEERTLKRKQASEECALERKLVAEKDRCNAHIAAILAAKKDAPDAHLAAEEARDCEHQKLQQAQDELELTQKLEKLRTLASCGTLK